MPDGKAEDTRSDGAEPVYGPAYGARNRPVGADDPVAGAPTAARGEFDGPAPSYTAPYPPYPSDVPYAAAIPPNIAAGLAYLVAPAVIFLLLPPYRSQPLLRFHSWQAIFYFIAGVAVREVEQLLVSMMPSAIAFTIGGLVTLLLFTGWVIAVIKALQGGKWRLPFVGEYAERTASTTSSRASS